MVDVSGKQSSIRTAKATGLITFSRLAYKKVRSGQVEKGEILSVARISAIVAAKKASEIIPLCHPLMIGKVDVAFGWLDEECAIECSVAVTLEAKTGPEMEAIAGVMGGLITIYDMCKAVDKSMMITGVRLEAKTGGKSGDWKWTDQAEDGK